MSEEIKEELALSPQQKIGKMLQDKKTTFSALLPRGADVERFIKSALLAVMRNPELLKCTSQSIVLACIDAAEINLDFTPAKGWAYLVPYKGKAVCMSGYRGLIHLALQTGEIENMEASVVYQNDVFNYEKGLNPKLEHKPVLENPGKAIGAYAIAWFKSGKPQYEFMTESQINHVKKSSKAGNSETSPWVAHSDEMRKKTVARRLFKYLPSSYNNDKLYKAIEADNMIFDIDSIPLAEIVEDEPVSKSATENIMNTLKKDDLKPDAKQEDLELK